MASLMGLPPVLGIFTSILTGPITALLGRNPVLIGGTASATVPFIALGARPAEQRCRSCTRELRNFEIEERAPVARPAPAHASPAQASLQDAEGQDLEILMVRARFFAGKAAAALLLCERTLPGRAVAHSIFRHMNDEDGTLRRLTPVLS